MQFSVVIPTYNRAGELQETLASLAKITNAGSWEVIVVDNNSTDATRQVVADAAANFPVELRYLLERQVGRSAALNAGIKAAAGENIATADDGCSKQPKRWSASSAILWAARFCRFGAGPSPRGSLTREGGTGL